MIDSRPRRPSRRQVLAALAGGAAALVGRPSRGRAANASEAALRWLPGRAYHIPSVYTSEESGYQSLGEAGNGKIYIGAAKYGVNAYLVEFDPAAERFGTAADVMQVIGSDAAGFRAQAKIHSHLPVGASGKIYFGSKQGYPGEGEKVEDYPGGYPLVYDPATGQTRAYPIPVPHHGVISHIGDEARGLSYVSTCDDGRPIESTHFLVLNLRDGTYRDLGDLARSYAYIQLDYRGRALHLAHEAKVGAYDPDAGALTMLEMRVEGGRPEPGASCTTTTPCSRASRRTGARCICCRCPRTRCTWGT